MPSFVLIRPTVWPQCTNVTDRQTDSQRTDSIGRTVLQKVAQNGSRENDHAHLRVVCHPKAILDMAYRCTKFDDSSFSCSREMFEEPKLLNGTGVNDHAPFRGGLSSVGWDSRWLTYVPNLTSVSPPVTKIGKAR